MNEYSLPAGAGSNAPTPAAPGWVIHCDFDGTISHKDVIDTLLNRYGMPGWQEWEDAWVRGEIGSRECMQNQVALLDMSLEELRASLAEIEIDTGFANFVAAARQAGVATQIVSDGMDYSIQCILQNNGLGELPIFANHLEPAGPRRWSLQTPWTRLPCQSANCKCGHLTQSVQQHLRVLYIGDGRSDFCVAGKADFVFAKASLLKHCQQNGLPHAAFSDFNEALALLPSVLASGHATLVA